MRIFEEDGKAYVNFSYTAYGKTHSVNMELSDECTWPEVLGPIISTLEGAFGYPFDLYKTELGIYYPGKNDESE